MRGRPRPHPGAVQGLNCGRGRPRTTADGRSSAPAIRITLDRQDDRQYNLERSDRDWGQTPPVRQRCIVANRDDGELQVKFKGPATRGHSVPVEVLTGSPADNEVGRSVAGRLKEIDFDKRRIRLEHPPTGRQLTCSYPRQLEHTLVDWRRNLIQVLGEVTTGPDDIPKRIRSVDDIHLVDLSPIELREFITQGRRVRAREPIVFEPAMDDAYQHYVVRDGPFGIRLISLTRGDLETNLNEEMDVLWRHYACADDAKLTRAAQQLKQQLNGAFHPR